MTNVSFPEEIRTQACLRMQENRDKILKCLSSFDDATIWHRSNTNSLAIGNQLLHLCGNITQYILSGLAGAVDERKRDQEFSATEGWSKADLTTRFNDVIDRAIVAIRMASDEDLLRYRTVQGFHLSGVGMVLHVVEHMSYHTGQIVAWTKQRENRPMGFYDGIDLNTRNEKDS